MAAARAEARRKAILSRGTDRLARLTTSARGEDGDSPLPNILTSPAPNTQSFLGEESSDMPTPASHARPLDRKVSGRMMTKTVTGTATSSTAEGDSFFESLSNSSTATGTPHNPSAWLPEQQQLFMQGRLHAAPSGNASLSGLSSSIGDPAGPIDPFAPPIDNPFASLMGFSGSGTEGTLPAGLQTLVQESKPKTSLQKALPLLHLVAVWCLLAYFLLWAEPKSYAQANSAILGDEKWNAAGLWMRWAELGKSDGLLKRGITTYRLQIVPFFWAFTTLEIILHSLRIFAGFNAVQPPSLVAFALPHLPPPIPSIIIISLKYMQMGSLILDDLSGVIVGLGFITYFSGWLVGSS